jgi:hypothetical protein
VAAGGHGKDGHPNGITGNGSYSFRHYSLGGRYRIAVCIHHAVGRSASSSRKGMYAFSGNQDQIQ